MQRGQERREERASQNGALAAGRGGDHLPDAGGAVPSGQGAQVGGQLAGRLGHGRVVAEGVQADPVIPDYQADQLAAHVQQAEHGQVGGGQLVRHRAR
ncbi:hypothetical protein Amac_102160 [Acrocarpospora macrocephala]|uniref:Uncharacterized protein n=1 Tax=Acrocarpospora macrocephala TaxID=150177 RepID=A0A5M3XEX2_9ACTN|nr:hypothetical protein Amac_102160 [Acrocarpospora macrocephala]